MILEIFGKIVKNLQVLVGDNENTNKAVADPLRVPFIACARHRMNLAVNEYLSPYEPLLEKIQGLMKKMSSVKKLAKLRQKTELRPVLRNKTRWTCTFAMVDRFYAIKDFVDHSDVEIASLLLTPKKV